MKHWLVFALFAVIGGMVGVALKTVVVNHTAAAQPATSSTAGGQ